MKEAKLKYFDIQRNRNKNLVEALSWQFTHLKAMNTGQTYLLVESSFAILSVIELNFQNFVDEKLLMT